VAEHHDVISTGTGGGTHARTPAGRGADSGGGGFLMGSDGFYPEERPVGRVEIDGFWMNEHPVTVAEFRRFVAATGHMTVAGKEPG
jgi:formylglycine-generating enzyme required for sulfatase activity